MSLARLVTWVGIVALILGIIAFLLPGKFIFFPQIEAILTKFGDALFKGVSANPTITMLIAKAPAVFLMAVGFCMLLWGTMKQALESRGRGEVKPQDTKRTINDLIAAEKGAGLNHQGTQKSAKELADPRRR